jgi:type IV pilus assembly protein PilO
VTVRQSRRVIFVAVLLLLLVDVAAIGVLFSPMAKSREDKQKELAQLQERFKQEQIEIGPSHGMDKKIDAAKLDIADFYAQRLSGQYSQIDASLDKDAKANSVQLMNVNYHPDKKSGKELQRVAVQMTISGSYVNDVKFINAMERDKVFFLIDSVTLGGNSNGVQLVVTAETYFRTGAA